jgi:hypothetical protein
VQEHNEALAPSKRDETRDRRKSEVCADDWKRLPFRDLNSRQSTAESRMKDHPEPAASEGPSCLTGDLGGRIIRRENERRPPRLPRDRIVERTRHATNAVETTVKETRTYQHLKS